MIKNKTSTKNFQELFHNYYNSNYIFLIHRTKTNKLSTDVQKSKSKMETFLKESILEFTELKTKINNLELNDTRKFECIEKIQELESKMRKLETENDIIFDENYNKVIDDLKTKQKELRKRDKMISDLEDFISDSESKIKKLERENNVLKNKSEESEKDLQDSETQINDLNQKNRALVKELKELKDKYSYEDNVKKSSNEVTNLKISLKSKENLIEEKDKIIDEYKLKSTELQEKLKSRNRNFDEEIEKQNTKIKNLNREIEGLRSDNEKKRQNIMNLQDKINNFEKDNGIKKQNPIYEIPKDNFCEKCKELKSANEKIFQLEAEIKKMKSSEVRSSEISPTKFPSWWSSHMYK